MRKIKQFHTVKDVIDCNNKRKINEDIKDFLNKQENYFIKSEASYIKMAKNGQLS